VRVGRRRLAALAVALPLAACGPGPVGAPAGPTFTVGGITFRVASAGVERGASGFTLWMTDAADTCQAIVGTPVQTTTFWKLEVAPPVSGSTAAAVVPPKLAPAPGEALGRLEQRTGGVPGPGYDAAEGALAWTLAADGTITVDALDVGYDGAAGRVTGDGLVFRPCN
jgi:hypothetical protein